MSIPDYSARDLYEVTVGTSGPVPAANLPAPVTATVTFSLTRQDGRSGQGPHVKVDLGLPIGPETLAFDLPKIAIAAAQALLLRFGTATEDETNAAMQRWIDDQLKQAAVADNFAKLQQK
jgi:hypothetical protein